MSKATVHALERVFAAEINDSLPFQSKAKIYLELDKQGFVSTMERTFGNDAFKVTIKGYQLTHAGRLFYCSNCSSHGDAGPADGER